MKLDRHYGGWRPSLPDPRDHVANTSELGILPEVDPRKLIASELGVYDQQQLGSCTANATCRAVACDALLDGQKVAPARLATYWGERFLEKQPVDQDTGAQGRDGFKWMRRVGWWPESQIPYSDQTSDPDFYEDPRQKHGRPTGRLAKPYKTVAQSIVSIKRVLSNRQTVAFGFTVFESFESPEVAKTGVMPVPDVRREEVLGGHEVLCVGYLLDEPDYALVENSWGAGWGLAGFFLMPWKVLMDPRIAGDLRTIYRPKGA